MKRMKALVLALALTLGFAAGLTLAPSAEAKSGCFFDGCNYCCYTDYGLVCTDRYCP